MSLWFALISFTCIAFAADAKDTIVVFGGNGFVGRRICEAAVSRSYRVISVSRSGCPDVWAKEPWAQGVEWYSADALNVDSFADYIADQNPVAVFTMMGTLNPYKQVSSTPDEIFEYAGTTNINVCNVAASIKSVQKFVFIGAEVQSIGVNPGNENNPFALWTEFWLGQYNAKLAVEECVDTKFGDNGITFRPTIIAGNERIAAFGNMFDQDAAAEKSWFEFNRLLFYENPSVRKFYKFMMSDWVMDVRELAEDALDFINDGDVAQLRSPHHSKKPQEVMAAWKVTMLQNSDNIAWIFICGVAMALVSLVSRICC